MNDENQDIVFEIGYEGNVHVIHTHRFAYRNLMMLISDTIFPDYFGECGGQGRCGTCTIRILSGLQALPPNSRNEQSTLQKTGSDQNDIRLSCQLLIDESLHGMRIEILENY